MNKVISLALLTSSQTSKRLTQAFQIRFILALVALILQVFIISQLIQTHLAAFISFNVPLVAAALGCLISPKLISGTIQKIIKILLKVSIAKAFGSILLAVYIGLKCFSGSSQSANMRLCAIYFGTSATVDIVSSLAAYFAIKKTRTIIRVLRREEKKTQRSILDALNSSSESSECGSATLSDRSSRISL